MEYLGHVISKDGVATKPEKIKGVAQWPQPTNLKQLRGFSGLSGYYQRFIRDYAKLSQPLTGLLKANTSFKWNEEADKAFNLLKKALTSAPVLAMPNFQ